MHFLSGQRIVNDRRDHSFQVHTDLFFDDKPQIDILFSVS